jgi:hypothetical protein
MVEKGGWKALYERADKAGQEAADRKVPQPMLVGTPTTPFGNDIDPTKRVYFVRGGLCGFATVTIKPATGGFVKWLKGRGIGYKAYYGGWAVPCNPRTAPDLAQAVEIKEAYARAFAEVLRDAGINVYVDVRLD